MSSALYRKYRPKDFEGVIGQQHITATLKNQILSGRVGHAYLFCGSRGVGKTSLARIFSRAINCQNPHSAPCGTCAVCKANQNENNLDIIEIDAASNNGVDDARDLREKIKYPPISGKYKVYIIDEVHMLTGSAFNALLKTLEEPPAHAVFILATTEPHKLPATILSRCLRFDFHLVSMNLLSSLLSKIYHAEGKEFEDDAVRAIAAAAEGSVRDGLSLADMCLNLSAGKLTVRDVNLVLNTGDEKTVELLDRINKGDITTSLTLINDLAVSGKSMNAVAKEAAQYARDLMIAKTAPQLLETTNELKEKLVNTSQNFSISGLAALINLFCETENSLRYAVSPRIAMETAAIRAIKMYSLDLNAIDERLLRLEKQIASRGSQFASDGNINIDADNNINNSVDNAQKGFSDGLGGLNSQSAQANQGLSGVEDSFNSSASPQKPLNGGGSSFNSSLTPQRPLTAAQVWGRVITYFRKNSTPAFCQTVGRQNPEKLNLKDGVFTVFASREDFLSMCDNALLEDLRRAFLDLNVNYRINVEKDSDDIDLEKEILDLTGEFGSKVNIK